jgi:hypothetical protein
MPGVSHRLELRRDSAKITQCREYLLDLHGVDSEDIRGAAEILRKMNFDNRFLLKIAAL